jgi:hypothetical protein
MSKRTYGMVNCPIPNKKPEFKYEHTDPASNLSIEFGIGEYDDKTACQSYIDINSDNGGSYGLNLAFKVGDKWYGENEVQAVRVQILGSFERGGFKYALQKAGLMTIPFYGTITDKHGYWEG